MLHNELDYEKANREDIVARLMAAQSFAQLLLKAFDALVTFGVNFKTLPEWSDMTTLERAAKMRPVTGTPLIIGWFSKLDSALDAAVRRKQFRLMSSNPRDPKPQ